MTLAIVVDILTKQNVRMFAIAFRAEVTLRSLALAILIKILESQSRGHFM